MNPIYILYAIPVFFLLMSIELVLGWLKKQKNYRFNDSITNLNIGVGNQALNLMFKAFVLGAYMITYDNFAFFHLPITWWSFLLCLVAYDFFYYWAHRLGHEINFLWGSHIVHHQSEEYNLSVALRQSWFNSVIAFFIFIPLPLMGFDPFTFLAAMATNTLYQFWIHTRTIDKLPWIIEYFWNTPSHHRVHHAIDPKYIDKNYAGVWMIWDRIFGTFMEEEEEPTYGITTQLKSWNPAWANVHYYIYVIQQMRKMEHWQDRLKMLFARPGWVPEELGGFQTPPEVDKNTHSKYDSKVSPGLNFYVLGQFLLIVIGLCAFMFHFENITLFYKLLFAGSIILSTMICGAIFEGKKWVFVAEYLRLAVVLFALNTFYYFWHSDWFIIMLVCSFASYLIFNLWFTFSAFLKGRIPISSK